MGRIYKPQYSMTLASGQRVTRTVKWWHIEYTDASGRTRRRKAAPTQALAREILIQAEAEVAKAKAGLPAQSALDSSAELIAKRYLDSLKTRACADHLASVAWRLRAIMTGTRAVRLRDLTPERVEAFLAEMEDGSVRAPRTLNTYLQAVRGMFNWAVRMRLVPFNPLVCLSPRREDRKVKRRRPLAEEELTRLFDAARRGPLLREERKRWGSPVPEGVRHAMLQKGERNCLIYRMLTYTGLRLGELSRLRWSDVDIEAKLVTVRAESAKNGKEETIDLPEGLAAMLGAWKASHANPVPESLVMAVPATILKTFDADLALAGIPKRDPAGRTVDLHALRHTYGTLLIRAGADIKTVQTLMRHSTPVLTLGTYVHYDRAKLREAVAALPAIGAPKPAAIPTEAVAS